MEKRDSSNLSNAELKLYIETLTNYFEAYKIKLKQICEEMGDIENEYLSAQRELEMRKNIHL